MTPRSPDEALHFRGKTLTPESPRPLHIAEPDNIPVLQNQMDPVFNDTSTYETQAFVPEGDLQVKQDHHDPRAVPRSQVQQSQHNGEPSLDQHCVAAGTDPAGVMGNTGQMQGLGDQQHQNHQHHQQQYTGSYHTGSFPGNGLRRMNETSSSAAMSTPSTTTTITTTTAEARNEAARNSSLTALPPSDPASSLTHQPFSNRPPPPSSSNTLPAANEVDHPMMDWTAQSAASEDRLDTQPHDNVPNSGEGGVDFQNLLDNLPSSSSAAPSVPAVSETAPSSLQNYASAIPQATADAEGANDEALKSSTGLPPRPPPQEEPSTHPNYNPSDDIRTYHQLPSQTSNPPTSYPSQQHSNNNQSNTGAPALAAAGAPGTSSGVSSLPPPPGLNIQKTESSGAEPQESSVLKNGRENQAARPPKNGDEDSPWGPEVQRKYDDFLHNERIYVTEGLWDRFPPGSRLFVG